MYITISYAFTTIISGCVGRHDELTGENGIEEKADFIEGQNIHLVLHVVQELILIRLQSLKDLEADLGKIGFGEGSCKQFLIDILKAYHKGFTYQSGQCLIYLFQNCITANGKEFLLGKNALTQFGTNIALKIAANPAEVVAGPNNDRNFVPFLRDVGEKLKELINAFGVEFAVLVKNGLNWHCLIQVAV